MGGARVRILNTPLCYDERTSYPEAVVVIVEYQAAVSPAAS